GARPVLPASPAPAPAADRPSAPTRPPAALRTPPPAPASPETNVCPACHAALLPGAIACMDCGYLLQSDGASETEGTPCLCPTRSGGAASAPTDRHCQRCGSPLPTAPGTMLHGRYRIERLLAIGGFGAVYLATDTKQGNREVAIKDMICADSQEFGIRLKFFRREADILHSLRCVPIVPR